MLELRRARFAREIPAFVGLALLAGCIGSAKPLLTDAQPLIGPNPRLEFYVLRDGAAREPAAQTFAWRNDRYVPVSAARRTIFTISRCMLSQATT